MKSLNQFTALTEAEVLDTNGGGLLDSVFGLANSVVNQVGTTATILSVGATTTAALLGSGAGSALTSIGAGLGVLLSKLGLPTV